MKTHTKTLLTAFAASAMLAGSASAALITGVTIEDFSSQLVGPGQHRFAENVINGNGFDEGTGFHVTNPNDNAPAGAMWLTNGTFASPNDLLPAHITFDLEGNYDLNSFEVWNYNEQNLSNRGANSVDISVASSVGGAFTLLGNFTFTQAPGAANVDFGQVIDLSSFAAADNTRLIRFDILTNHTGGANEFAGLSEVRFDGVPEPGSLALLGLGGLLIGARRRRA